MEPDGLVRAVSVHLGHEGRAEGGLAELVELVVDEAEEDAALADARVADHDHLYLGQVLLHF